MRKDLHSTLVLVLKDTQNVSSSSTSHNIKMLLTQ